MTAEIEAVVLAGEAGFLRRRRAHARPPGSPCANCGTALQGPWCYACGQLGEDYHRSVLHLLAETMESFTHMDGRFWRTLPRLAIDPDGLTRAYVEGRRAAQIPPLRLFLAVLLLVFAAGSLGRSHDSAFDSVTRSKEAMARLHTSLDDLKVDIGRQNETATKWLKARLSHALDSPEAFKLILQDWAERFAFLMLPVTTALLTLLYAWHRRLFIFDHAVFALHSLSFQGILLMAVMASTGLTAGLSGWLLLASPVHLFVHLRGFYGSGVIATLLRMGVLFVGSAIGFVVLLLGLLWVGLSALGAAG